LLPSGRCQRAPLAQLAEQRTLNPRVRGSSPWRRTRSDLGFYRPRSFFSCPFCPLGCSVVARAHGPSNPGLVKNGASGAWRGGIRPRTAPPCRAGAAPGSLDQWSRPSRQGRAERAGVPIPVPSHTVRPAGNRHSCGDTPLMPRARHAGCLPGMRWAAARCSRAAASPARLRPKQQVRWVNPSGNGAQNVRVRVMSTDCVQVYALQRRLQASAWTAAACGGYCRARQAGARAATAGLDARGRRGIPTPGTVAPARGLCAPRTAYGRVGTGRRDQHPGRPIRDGRE
jgi:hypothetical protein